jgi:hypothetical protein
VLVWELMAKLAGAAVSVTPLTVAAAERAPAELIAQIAIE